MRYEPLVAKNAISRQEYETAVAVERAAEAAVEAARAASQRAEIDLSYTKVVAPEDGLVGKTEVYPGTLVGRGQSTLLTHISQIDTIHVRFTLPERDYLFYARRRHERGPEDGHAVDCPSSWSSLTAPCTPSRAGWYSSTATWIPRPARS